MFGSLLAVGPAHGCPIDCCHSSLGQFHPGLKLLIVEILPGFCSGVVRLGLKLRCDAMIAVLWEESDDLFDGCYAAVAMCTEEDRVVGCVMFEAIVIVTIVAPSSKVPISTFCRLEATIERRTVSRDVPTRSVQ